MLTSVQLLNVYLKAYTNKIASDDYTVKEAGMRKAITPLKSVMFKAIKRIVDEFSDVRAVYPVHLNPKVREVANEVLGNDEKIKIWLFTSPKRWCDLYYTIKWVII